MAEKRGGQHHADGGRGYGTKGRDNTGDPAGEVERETTDRFSQAEADRRAAEYAKRHPSK